MCIYQDTHILDYLDDSLELSVPRDGIVFMITFSCSEGHDIEAGRLQGGRPGSTGPEAHPRESPWGRGPAGKELRGRGRGSKASTGAGAAGSPRVREG